MSPRVGPEWELTMCMSLDFDDILATVAFLLDRNPKGEFWTAYQERRY